MICFELWVHCFKRFIWSKKLVLGSYYLIYDFLKAQAQLELESQSSARFRALKYEARPIPISDLNQTFAALELEVQKPHGSESNTEMRKYRIC